MESLIAGPPHARGIDNFTARPSINYPQTRKFLLLREEDELRPPPRLSRLCGGMHNSVIAAAAGPAIDPRRLSEF